MGSTAVTSRARFSQRMARLWGKLTHVEWMSVFAMAGVVLALHIVGWGLLVVVIAPQQYQVGQGEIFGVGLGVTAYMLGMRHAFDADHIAAIDNTTRKLMSDGKRPLSVGFWFSLGHSSVVFGLCVLLALGVRALAGQVADDGSALQQTTGLIGTAVSGIFLLLIGIMNALVLRQIWGVSRRMRHGTFDEAELEHHLAQRGLLNRVLGRVTRAVTASWHMYPVGLLFGLGFDTATEVSLLVLAGGAAAFSLPWYAIVVLPILFAAGMSLLDSIDGCFMNFAYGWAFAKPARKVFYNATVTALSVAVALIIGGIEIISILTDKLEIETGPLAWVGNLDLNLVGYIVVATFVVAWVAALIIWRVAKVEEKWSVTDVTDAPVLQPADAA